MFINITETRFMDGQPFSSPIRSDFTLIKGATFAINSAHVISLQEVEIGGETRSLLRTQLHPELLVKESFDNLQKSLGLIAFEQLAPGTGKIALNPQYIADVYSNRKKGITGIAMVDKFSRFTVKGEFSEVLERLNA